jgi:DNA-directed RNA polymerase I subunit RPA1
LFVCAQTYEGGYKAFNRMGIESCVAPFQKMSFETTTAFLRSATLYAVVRIAHPHTNRPSRAAGLHRMGSTDYLDSPSSRLVLGKPVLGGTGGFDLLADLGGVAL